MPLTPKERDYLRALAKKVAEYAQLPEQAEKAALWNWHNNLQRGRPMVLIFPEGSWQELIPLDSHIIQDPFYRPYEWDLRNRIYYAEYLKDDSVIDDTVYAPLALNNTMWGIETQSVRPEELRGACHFEPVIKEEEDIEKIQTPRVTVDRAASEENYRKVLELFGDILRVEKRGLGGWGFSPIDTFAQWRGFDQLFLDLTERPAWVHTVLRRMTDGYIAMFDQFERLNALSLNNGNHYVGSGGIGFTDELPQKDFNGTHVRTVDMWGHATTQIFSLVSPAMHNEFALTYEKQYLDRFGLNCYGCCEPLHKKLDYIKEIPRLRRISMSPWVDVAEGAAGIEDKYIFSYKPNPAVLAAETWDPAAVRKGLREVLERTRGCILEIVMKDTHTCRKQPQRMAEWVGIAKKTVEEFA